MTHLELRKKICDHVRGVVPGDAMAPSDFGGSVKPISTGGELREAIVPKK